MEGFIFAQGESRSAAFLFRSVDEEAFSVPVALLLGWDAWMAYNAQALSCGLQKKDTLLP